MTQVKIRVICMFPRVSRVSAMLASALSPCIRTVLDNFQPLLARNLLRPSPQVSLVLQQLNTSQVGFCGCYRLLYLPVPRPSPSPWPSNFVPQGSKFLSLFLPFVPFLRSDRHCMYQLILLVHCTIVF